MVRGATESATDISDNTDIAQIVGDHNTNKVSPVSHIFHLSVLRYLVFELDNKTDN